MQRFGLARIVKSAVVLTLATSLIAAPAAAGPVVATEPQLVSGLTPLPAPTDPGWCGTGPKRQNWEQDNALAVNPTNPDNLVAAWIQDWADAIVVGYSFDGGKTWAKSIPPTTPCTLGNLGIPPGLEALYGAAQGRLSAIDPWVSFDAAGTVYLSAILPEATGFLVSAAVVAHSRDGGRSWSAPAVVDEAAAPFAVDGSSITGDPTRADHAYVTWWKQACGLRRQYVSFTQTGGLSWSSPVPVPVEDGRIAVSGNLLVLVDGTLLNVASEIPMPDCLGNPPMGSPPTGPTTVLARHSTDGGITWSDPVTIGTAEGIAPASAALATDGDTVYASWQTRKVDSANFGVAISRSTDGGRTWEQAAAVAETLVGPPQANMFGVLAVPSLAVAPDGTVGVGFYDHRNDGSSSTVPHATDFWFRHSHDGGVHWEEEHLAGPFDQWSFPWQTTDYVIGAGPGFLGDYQGIAPVAGGFAVNFALGFPFAPATKNDDIFFSRLYIVEADLALSKTGPSGRVPTGRNMTYTLTVTNNGPDQAADTTVTDQLPPSVVFVSAAPSQGTCGESAGTVTCSLGSMGNGATATVDIVVRPNSAGTITNTATVSALTPDPNEASNTDSVVTSICRITSRRSSIPCG